MESCHGKDSYEPLPEGHKQAIDLRLPSSQKTFFGQTEDSVLPFNEVFVAGHAANQPERCPEAAVAASPSLQSRKAQGGLLGLLRPRPRHGDPLVKILAGGGGVTHRATYFRYHFCESGGEVRNRYRGTQK